MKRILVVGVAAAVATTLGAPAALAGADQLSLKKGWDSTASTLVTGKVVYNVAQQSHKVLVTYIVTGAPASTTFKVGVLQQVASTTLLPTAPVVRSGVPSWYLGTLTTSTSGSGSGHVMVTPRPGTWHLQFFVATTGGSVVYSTGTGFASYVTVLTK